MQVITCLVILIVSCCPPHFHYISLYNFLFPKPVASFSTQPVCFLFTTNHNTPSLLPSYYTSLLFPSPTTFTTPPPVCVCVAFHQPWPSQTCILHHFETFSSNNFPGLFCRRGGDNGGGSGGVSVGGDNSAGLCVCVLVVIVVGVIVIDSRCHSGA